jgi:site-specific recombinase XerD
MNDLSRTHDSIPILNPHELRHTYGTLLKNKGVDVYTIQKLMGHSEIGTTEIYIHDDIDALKRALGIN